MAVITWDGTNTDAVRELAGSRWEGEALLIRNGSGELTIVHPGYVIDGNGGGLRIHSAAAWAAR